MLAHMIRRQLAAFETRYDYDMAYVRDVLDVGLTPMLRWYRATAMGEWRRGVDIAPWFAAKLVSAQREDCGPCTQLVAQMAEEADVPRDHIGAILTRRWDALPDDVALAVRFTDAVLHRSEALDGLRAQVETRFGRAGLVSLTFALMSSRLYPDLKYAMGYGHACRAVVLGDEVLWTPGEPAQEAC